MPQTEQQAAFLAQAKTELAALKKISSADLQAFLQSRRPAQLDFLQPLLSASAFAALCANYATANEILDEELQFWVTNPPLRALELKAISLDENEYLQPAEQAPFVAIVDYYATELMGKINPDNWRDGFFSTEFVQLGFVLHNSQWHFLGVLPWLVKGTPERLQELRTELAQKRFHAESTLFFQRNASDTVALFELAQKRQLPQRLVSKIIRPPFDADFAEKTQVMFDFFKVIVDADYQDLSLKINNLRISQPPKPSEAKRQDPENMEHYLQDELPLMLIDRGLTDFFSAWTYLEGEWYFFGNENMSRFLATPLEQLRTEIDAQKTDVIERIKEGMREEKGEMPAHIQQHAEPQQFFAQFLHKSETPNDWEMLLLPDLLAYCRYFGELQSHEVLAAFGLRVWEDLFSGEHQKAYNEALCRLLKELSMKNYFESGRKLSRWQLRDPLHYTWYNRSFALQMEIDLTAAFYTSLHLRPVKTPRLTSDFAQNMYEVSFVQSNGTALSVGIWLWTGKFWRLVAFHEQK